MKLYEFSDRIYAHQWNGILTKVRNELKKVQERMKKYYYQSKRVLIFNIKDYFYLKLQLYGQKTLMKNLSLKLSKRYYGPFKVIDKWGDAAYKLELPQSSKSDI